VLQGLDILALTACVAEAVGRWGCFFSGAARNPDRSSWAVTFPEIAHRLHPGLPDVPIHPTQIYMSVNAILILGILLMLYRHKRFHGRIISVYVLLYAVTRFFIEFVRGDADRGFVLGSRWSTSQFLGLVLAVLAVLTYRTLDRRHRLSGEPD
jgi:phosphatidylglycerol:prolipoprotein diacylglycerol transferase